VVATVVNLPNFANYTAVNSDVSAHPRFIGGEPRALAFSLRHPHGNPSPAATEAYQDERTREDHTFDTHN
jgi:hypothetical protein